MIRRAAVAPVFFTLTLTTLARAQDPTPPTPAAESVAEPAGVPEPAPTPEPTVAPAPPIPTSRPAPVQAPAPSAGRAPVEPRAVPDADEEREAPRRHWYGWQTLIADGAVLGFLTAAVLDKEHSEFFGYSALAGYVVAAPIIHFTHGNPGRAFGSLGLRVGAPIVVGITAQAITGCGGDFCGVSGLFFGAIGALGVMGVDAGLIAYEDAEDSARRVIPVIALNPGMTYVGARGAF